MGRGALESGEGQTSFRQTLTRAFAGSHPVKSPGREETCVFASSYVRQSGGEKQRGGVGTTRRQDGDCGGKLTSLQTSMVPKMTCRPSKKLSPMMMTVAPPVVQPSLGLMALMQGGVPGRKDSVENLTRKEVRFVLLSEMRG